MKTIAKTNKENRIQQVVLKTTAVLISLVLLSYNINAQGIWKTMWEDASLAMETYQAENNEVIYASNVAAKEADDAMELESWMINTRHFTAHVELKTETENALELEAWMTDAAYFAPANFAAPEAEEALELENWMVINDFGVEKDSVENKKSKFKATNEEHATAESITVENQKGNYVVKAKNFTYRELKEPALKFEHWMFDSRHFSVKK